MVKNLPLDVTIVLPAYNEEKNLENCIMKTISIINKLPYKYEIVIVENGSTDSTLKIAKTLSNKFEQVRAFHIDEPSFGGAIRHGYHVSRGKVIVNFDVDLSTDLIHLEELLELSKKYDVVTGSRYLTPELVERNLERHFLSTVFNRIFIRGLLGSKLKDNNCGFRAAKRNVGLKIFDRLENTGLFGMVEFIVIAQKKNFQIKEFPVKWKENYRKMSAKTVITKFLIPSLKLWYRINFKNL